MSLLWRTLSSSFPVSVVELAADSTDVIVADPPPQAATAAAMANSPLPNTVRRAQAEARRPSTLTVTSVTRAEDSVAKS